MSDVLVVRLHGRDVGEIVRFDNGRTQFEFYPPVHGPEGPSHFEPVVLGRSRQRHRRGKTHHLG